MRALQFTLNLIAGLILTRFTISKFAAWPVSVAAFEDMAKPLGIDPTFFRIGTGFIIGFAAISFFINCIIILLNKQSHAKCIRLFTVNIFYSFGAMIGALFAEFLLRSSVKWPLVYIAIGVLVISLANLVINYREIRAAFQKQTPDQNKISLIPSEGNA